MEQHPHVWIQLPLDAPVFQVDDASRRTSPLSKSCGFIFSALVASISQPGVMLFKESVKASTTYSVCPLVEAKTIWRTRR
jgi:hypothetical protein